MRKPCRSCGSIIVVSRGSLPNPQCHSCRAKARVGNCPQCGVAMDTGKPGDKRRFCSMECLGASRKVVYRVESCEWCSKPFTYTPDHKYNKFLVCSKQCAGYLRMIPSRPWKPPVVKVPIVKVVRQRICLDCSAPAHYKQFRCSNCRLIRKRLIKAYQRNVRRSREIGALVEHIDPLDIYERDQGICHICESEIDLTLHYNHRSSFTLDHLVPISLGGATTRDNLSSAHRYCNSSKGARWVA